MADRSLGAQASDEMSAATLEMSQAGASAVSDDDSTSTENNAELAELQARVESLVDMRSVAASWLVKMADNEDTRKLTDSIGELTEHLAIMWAGILEAMESPTENIKVVCEKGRDNYNKLVQNYRELLNEASEAMLLSDTMLPDAKRARTEQQQAQAD